MRDANENVHALLEGASGNLWLGGKAADGDIVLFASGEDNNRDTANATIHLNGDGSTVRFRDSVGNVHALMEGGSGDVWLGGKAASGDISPRERRTTRTPPRPPSILAATRPASGFATRMETSMPYSRGTVAISGSAENPRMATSCCSLRERRTTGTPIRPPST
jgi:hypothetical protein